MKGAASKRRMLTIGLLTLCAALGILAFLPPPLPAPEPAERVDTVSLPEGGGEAPLQLRVSEGDAFRRPIFVASRRMPQTAGPNGAAPLQGLKLKAVFLGPGVEKALVTAAGQTEGTWITTDQEFEGWQVESITAETVVLSGQGGRRTLDLEKPEAEPIRHGQRMGTLQRQQQQQQVPARTDNVPAAGAEQQEPVQEPK